MEVDWAGNTITVFDLVTGGENTNLPVDSRPASQLYGLCIAIYSYEKRE